MNVTQADVVVVGGGPAGSTAAALLAQKGRRVVLLEKEKFPRYHIGESLIPYTYFTLERLGMIEALRASAFPRKYSVQFVSQNGKASQPFYFFQHLKHEAAQTWQVVRADFDQMLLNNARQRGAVVHEQTTAKEAIIEDGAVVGVRAVDAAGTAAEFRAPITIDASGRDAFTIVRRDWRQRDPQLNKVAVWTYYRGAQRDPGLDEGATTVAYVPYKGWFWYIPLPDDVVSVGVVAERAYLQRAARDPEAIFRGELEENRWIKDHVARGQVCGPYRTTAEYSYRARHCATDGLVLTGDAFAFLDPVFSSGVFLALRGGELAADAVDAALAAGDTRAARFADYGRQLCYGIESMRRLVYAFYDQGFSFGDLIRKHPERRGDVTDCLSGGLFRDFTALFAAVADFAGVPAPLPYGGPEARKEVVAGERE
jgi:flavin-dependent dehydrogenase